MNSLRYLNAVLTILAVLLGLQLYTSWTASPTPSLLPEARADGIPDIGAINMQIVGQLKALNGRVDEISGMLASGKARVTVINPENK